MFKSKETEQEFNNETQHLRYQKTDSSVFINALKDSQFSIRIWAIESLGNLGLEGKEAIPALIEALKDENINIRWRVAESLGKIGSEAIPALIEALKDKDERVQWIAIKSLGKLGSEANTAIPTLKKILQENQDLQQIITETIKKITTAKTHSLVTNSLGNNLQLE